LISWKDESVLACLLFLCLICHGMFFAREWLVLGTLILVYRAIVWRIGFESKGLLTGQVCNQDDSDFCRPLGIFFLLIAFSLLGLFHPVRMIEGWLDGFRWLLFMSVYLWGRKLAVNPETRHYILNEILLISLLGTLLAWLPGSELIWPLPGSPEEGRFAATFGYPNAAAVLMGCQVLLMLKDKRLMLLLMVVPLISIVWTGSRGAVILLIFFSGVIMIKRLAIVIHSYKMSGAEGFLGFYKDNIRIKENAEISLSIYYLKALAVILLLVLLQQTILRYQGSVDHLLDWTFASFEERLFYYRDSLKLAWAANFLPQAGGWLGFPFIQTGPYWTLYPHSSLSQIILNQGLAGVLILIAWAVKGFRGYLKDLCQGDDLTVICGKTAILYLGLHSLIDVDMSFGFLGIIFWLLVGMFSK